MNAPSLKYCYLVITLFILMLEPLYSQIPNFSKVPNLFDGDSLNITYLINNGIMVKKEKAICWFPKDSLSEKRMNEIADTINIGIAAAEKFINAPLPWQVHPFTDPYTFYFRFDKFIPHASCAGFVSISFHNIKEGKAPYLHEVMHEMLFSKTEILFSDTATQREHDEIMPLWLVEGLPDYVALKVSLIEKLPLHDFFSNSYQTNYDSMFAKDMAAAGYVLSFIGAKGMLPELLSDTLQLYTPDFYHGSCSFVKYLAENYDIKMLLTAISSYGKEQETIEKLTDKPLASLKSEWLNKLKNVK